MKFDVLAFDNALVDILVQVQDRDLEALRLTKGICNFPSDEHLHLLHEHIRSGNAQIEPGGSAANTATLMARLGAKVAFFNAIGKDEYAELYARDLTACAVHAHLARNTHPTGTAITYITPDAQRTFAVHLGASNHLTLEDIPLDAVQSTAFLYLTGYVLCDPKIQPIALEMMKRTNGKVVLDLSDPAVVEHNRDFLRGVLAEHVDIVFANEAEAQSFAQTDTLLALEVLSSLVDIAIVKIGKEGSLIQQRNLIRVPAHLVSAIDTTGAGDAYAAGFLLGLLHDKPLEVCGELGALLASDVIQHVGARLRNIPEQKVRELLK